MKVNDIKKFYAPRYSVQVSWDFLEEQLKHYDDRSCPGSLGLNLDPDFQRGHVWTEEKQIAYVEFCLQDGSYSRTLLFNHPNWMGSFVGEMVLVDGKQRLEAVRKFVRNELPIFGGNYLKDFDDPKKLLRTSGAHFVFGINSLKTRKAILEWYLQLNRGGVVHTDEEIAKVERMLKEETK